MAATAGRPYVVTIISGVLTARNYVYFIAILMLESPNFAMTTSLDFAAIEATPLMAFVRPTILPSTV